MQKRNFLLLPAIIAVVPVLSQVNYASLTSTSLTGQEKKFEGTFPGYSAFLKPFIQQFHSTSEPFFTSFPLKNVNAGEKAGYTGKRDKKNKLALAENMNETKNVTRNISFKPTSFIYPVNSKVDIGIALYEADQIILYAKALKQYAKNNGFDTSYAFLSNMGILSNKKRFFVVNLVTMEIENAGLVSHGRGQGPSVFDKQYSNQSGSKCTSLGRYRISGKYKGSYGEAYRMVGLDSSNRNAYSRNIVLHSMNCIPDIDGIMPACVSEGCPAVSIRFLSYLHKIIDSRKKPVLLWIFDSNLEEMTVEESARDNKPGPAKQL